MAVNFLVSSRTYRQQTSKNVQCRRETICKYLEDNYKVRKFKDDETYKSIVSELAKEGIEITKSQYQFDKVVIRTAYLWLIASTEEEKTKIATTSSASAKSGINCLIKDGLRTWPDLKLVDMPATLQEIPLAPTSVPLTRMKISECQAGQQVLEAFSHLVDKLEAMMAENEKLKGELAHFADENKRLSHQTEDLEIYIQLVEQENTALEERLKAAKEGMRHLHSASLEEIAGQHPEFPELFTIAQRMKEGQSRWQKAVNELQNRLPKIFTWLNDTGKICYEQHFLYPLVDLKLEEQEQVIRQVGVLAEQGAEQASLHTSKSWMRLPYSPTGCLVSRGSDDIRFTWKKNGDIFLFWLYRKGDSRVRQTER